MSETLERTEIRDEWGSLAPDFIERVRTKLQAGDAKSVQAEAEGLHAADLADLIEALEPEERVSLIASLGRSFDVEALAELDEGVRDQLMEALPPEVIASAIKKLDTDDALYLIEDLDRVEQQEILAQVPKEERAALKRALEYPEGTAGRLMQTEFAAVPAFWTVGQTLEHMRKDKDLPEEFVETYVVDPAFHLVGVVPVSRLLRNSPDRQIAEIMDREQTIFTVMDEQDDAAFNFEQYNLVSAPVVDADGRLVGMLTVDDILDVIQEE